MAEISGFNSTVPMTASSARFAKHLLLIFLSYEAIEGLARRFFSEQSQNLIIGKNLALAFLYLLVVLRYPTQISKIISKFDRTFMMLLFAFTSIILTRCIGSQAPFFDMVVSAGSYLLAFPIIFVAYLCSESDVDWSDLWRRLRPVIFLVAAYALLQAVTGFDTAASAGSIGVNDAASTAGGVYRNAAGEEVLVLSSTLYGGRLGTFGAFWTLVTGLLLILDIKKGRSAGPWAGAAVVAAIVCLALGQNRTATLSTLAVAIALALYSAFTSTRASRMFQLGVAICIAASLSVFVFGWLLNRGSVALPTSDIEQFLSQAASPDQYDVVTGNSWNGAKEIYNSQGFWGAGTGTLVPAFETRVDSPLIGLGAEGMDLRLLYELGIPGLAVFFALSMRLLYILIRAGIRIRRWDSAASISLFSGAGVLVTYLSLAHKHFGFAQDLTLQSYLFTFLGSVLASRRRRVSSQAVQATALRSQLVQASF